MPRLCAALTICLGVLIGPGGFAGAQTLDPEYQQDILKFMDIVGASRFGDQIATVASREIVEANRKTRPDLSQRAVDIINEVVQEKFKREFEAPNGLRDRLVRIYAGAFTHDEIRQLMAFYSTDVGRKSLAVLPGIAKESVQTGQQWATDLVPETRSEIQRRLNAEGITQ